MHTGFRDIKLQNLFFALEDRGLTDATRMGKSVKKTEEKTVWITVPILYMILCEREDLSRELIDFDTVWELWLRCARYRPRLVEISDAHI